MFVPVAMKKAELFVSGAQAEPVVLSLSRFERFHALKDEPKEDAGKDEPLSRWDRRAGEWQEVLRRSARLLDRLESKGQALTGGEPVRPAGDVDRWQARLSDAEEELKSWSERKKRAKKRLDTFREMKRQAVRLAPLNVPLERFEHSDHLHWVIGTMEARELDTLRFSLFENVAPQITAAGEKDRRLKVFVPSETVKAAAAALSERSDVTIENAGCRRLDEGGSRRGRADTYSKLIDRIEKLASGLDVDLAGASEDRSEDSADLHGDPRRIEEKLEDIERRVGELQRRREKTESAIRRTEQRRRKQKLFEPLAVPFERLRHSDRLHWAAGLVPKADLNRLNPSFFRMPALFIPAGADGDRVLVLAATPSACAALLDRALEGIFVRKVAFPEVGNDGFEERDRLRQYRESRDALEEERIDLRRRWRDKIVAMHGRATQELRAARTMERFGCRGDVFYASLKVPAPVVARVVDVLKDATDARAEVEVLAAAGEKDLPLEVMLFRIPLVILPMELDAERILVVAATSKDHAGVLDAAVRGVFLEPAPFPGDFRGLPGELLDSVEARLTTAEEEMAALKREQEELAGRWFSFLKAVRDAARARKEIADAVSALPNRDDVYRIAGWVPEPDAGRLVETVKAAADGNVDVELSSPPDEAGRRPPTLLRNPRIFKPFEVIVNTFGAPGYREIDPTPLTAVVFTLMYGMMFGDIGHGLLLAAAGWVLGRRAGGAVGAVGGVLTASGAAAAFFGFLYGSVFGYEHLYEAPWLSPLEGIVPLLGSAVAGGVVLLSLGLFASIVNQVRLRNWGALMFGHGGIAGLALYWTLVGGAAAAAFGRISPALVAGLILVPAVLLVFEAPLTRLIEGRRPLAEGGLSIFLAEGVFGLFETVISDLSNSLSFVRLGAFAVAHAGFMKVVFLLAGQAGEPWSWAVLAAGTVLVVVFEGLVVGIQALRLQYYEFFSRFFSGRGVSFSPFRLSAAPSAPRQRGGG